MPPPPAAPRPSPAPTRQGLHRERGASNLAAALVTLIMAGIGFGGGFVLRQSGAASSPELELIPPGSTTVPDTTAAPVTTLGLGTTEVPTTTEAPPVETTQAPVATDPPTPAVALGTRGALFAQLNDRRLFDPTLGCDSFTESQGTGASLGCERFAVGNIEVAWSRDAEAGNVDILWQDPSAGENDIWNIALRANDSSIERDPRVGDVTGDGRSDIVVGASSGSTLQVDVIELDGAVPVVTLHLSLEGGRVRLGAGELHVWRAVPSDSEQLEHLVLTRGNGGWQVTGQELVNARNVGPSQV